MRERFYDEITAAMKQWSLSEVRVGIDDCAPAVADIIKKVLGKDAMRQYRGKYKSRITARKLVGKRGFISAIGRAAQAMHWKKIDPQDALAGDVGVGPINVKGKIVFESMICRAPGWFVARRDYGFISLPASSVKKAWSVK